MRRANKDDITQASIGGPDFTMSTKEIRESLKPAATGSGEREWNDYSTDALYTRGNRFDDWPIAQLPTPPASQPTVTLDRETFDHVRDYILPIYESRETIMAAVGYHDFAKDKCSCGGCWLYRQLERLGNALALLRAAEQK